VASNGFMTRTTLWTHEHLTTLGVTDAQLKQHLRDGTMVRGMAAVRLMHEHAERFTPVKLANLPLIAPLCDRLYPWFARNRYRFPRWLLPRPPCENSTCYLPPEKRTKK